MFSSWLRRFISNGTPNPDFENEYASYLNDADTLVMDYYTGKTMVSPVYSVRYGTKNHPLVKAEFYMETYYDAYHSTIPGQYINRVGMIVKSTVCSWGMHLDGSTDYGLPTYIGTEDNPIVTADGTTTVNYGDCCAVKRHGVLNFKVSGDVGYVQISWNSNT